MMTCTSFLWTSSDDETQLFAASHRTSTTEFFMPCCRAVSSKWQFCCFARFLSHASWDWHIACSGEGSVGKGSRVCCILLRLTSSFLPVFGHDELILLHTGFCLSEIPRSIDRNRRTELKIFRGVSNMFFNNCCSASCSMKNQSL